MFPYYNLAYIPKLHHFKDKTYKVFKNSSTTRRADSLLKGTLMLMDLVLWVACVQLFLLISVEGDCRLSPTSAIFNLFHVMKHIN